MKLLATKIKQARKSRQITQEDLARAIGVSDKSISAYESGRVHPPLEILEKIAKSTDHSMTYFVDPSAESSILQKLNEVQKLFEEIRSLLHKAQKK